MYGGRNIRIMQKERFNNLDLLRVISIYFVVCIHYVGWGGAAGATNIGLFNMGISGGLAVACNVAVNCFYMISGFFIKDIESFENCKKRIIKVYSSTWFYSVVLPIVAILFGIIKLDLKSTVFLGLPILSNQYWFSTCYIAMTALLPFIATMLKNLKQKEISILLGILLFLDCIQPILGINAFSNIGYGLLHAFTMYILGYWINRCEIKICSIFSVLIYITSVVAVIGIILLSMLLNGDRNRTISDYNSILMVIASFGLFMTFLNFRIKTKIFGRLAPYVFGVYLLNDNQYLREFLWQDVFHCSYFYNSNLLIVHFIVTTVVFTIVALCIEICRQKLGEQIIVKCRENKRRRLCSKTKLY